MTPRPCSPVGCRAWRARISPASARRDRLLICLALLFIVASALVAFRGWPHVGAQPSPGEVVVSPQPTASTGSRGRAGGWWRSRQPRLTGAARARRSDRRRRRVAVCAAAPRPRQRRSIGRPASTSLPVGAPAAAAARSPCVTGCGRLRPSLAAAGRCPRRCSSSQQTAQQGVQQATGALGKVVGNAGGKVSTVVQQTTNTAAGAVQTVSPAAAGVVQDHGLRGGEA